MRPERFLPPTTLGAPWEAGSHLITWVSRARMFFRDPDFAALRQLPVRPPAPYALRSPLSTLHSPLWLVTPDRPPRSQIEVQRQDQDFSTLFASSSRPCTRNPVQHVSGHQLTEPDARHAPPGCHSHPCKQAVGRPSNLHDEQDCQATQTLLSQVIHLWMLLKKRWPTYTTSSRCQVSR